MDSAFAESTFDWTLSLPLQHVHPASLHEGTGAVCETSRFDSFYNDSGDRVILPAGQKYTKRKGRSYQSALAVMTYWNEAQDLEKTVLEIRSPHMKAALKAVVPEYSSFNIAARNITIQGEPRCLFHYRQELLNHGATLQQRGDDPEAPKHIQHLISYMWDVFDAEISSFTVCELLNDCLEYQYLWMVFRPGDIVYVRKPGRGAFQFDEMVKQSDSWRICGRCIDYDGDSFGFRSTHASISHYENAKPLNELEVIKLDHLTADEKQAAKKDLGERGRKFISIRDQQYLWYDGQSDVSANCKTKGRIIIDCKGYINHGPGFKVRFLGGKGTFAANKASEEMTEADFMICHTSAAGYSFRDNKWDRFHLDSISDIKFDAQAFASLILPETQKQQILSLVHVHENDKFSFDDLIKGKGRGMIFLLYGETGLGKTLTAESIAEYCRKPLLRLDAGTLGTSAGSVERGLSRAFQLAERWHALLLLDEADVYLEQRKSKNLVHNGIVSVFLRMLEYYHGILFLTTNRISTFDIAFMSRIHLAIQYKPLTPPSRRELLLTFLNQTSVESAAALSQEGALDKLAEEQLNGRQIKNLVRTATALALSSDSPGCHINQQHLMMALQPVKQFSQVMEELSHPKDLEEDNPEEVQGVNEVERNSESDISDDEDRQISEEGPEEVRGVEEVESTNQSEAFDDEDDQSSEEEDYGDNDEVESERYSEDLRLGQSKRRRLF